MVDTHDSEVLEEMILALLKDKQPLTNKDFREMFFPTLRRGEYNPDLDRALQRLRKAGKVKPGPKGWILEATKPCPKCKGKGFVP